MSNHDDQPRTRFDHTRRNLLIGGVLLIIALLATGVTGLTIRASNADQRSASVLPRYIDIWAFYPDDTVRFVTRFHANPDNIDSQVAVAGPLMPGAEALLNEEPIGGSIVADDMLPGPGQDSNLVYKRYTLQIDDPAEAYGINVQTADSPYLLQNDATPDQRTVALGTVQQSYYQQVIVAVALPRGTDVTDTTDLTPYRTARISGWDIYYYDVTDSSGERAIRMVYTPADGEPSALNPVRIDERR